MLVKLVLAFVMMTTGLSGLPALASDWNIVSVNDVPSLEDPQISIAPDGAFAGSTGCNRFSGEGRMEDGQWIVTGPVIATRKACATPETQKQETAIFGLLSGAVSLTYDLTANQLTMSANTNTVTLVMKDEGEADPSGNADPVAAPSLNDFRYLDVFGLTGKLNIRADPTVGAAVIGKVLEGTLLFNEGCEPREDREWCHVKMLGATEKFGWAAAEYLKPATATLRVLQNTFDEIGLLDCTPEGFASATKCEYGIARDPNGTAVQVIYVPGGSARTLHYIDDELEYVRDEIEGELLTFSTSQNQDRLLIEIGNESYEFDLMRLRMD